MLETTTQRGRIIAAAMRLAGERDWSRVTLMDIAEAAGTTLVELKQDFGSKGEILRAFTRAVDDEVLRRGPRKSEGQSSRDQLFEVLMTRFDVLAPYKAALRSIVEGRSADPIHASALLTSQHWMLQAAGIDTSGIGGGIRIAGLASVYAGVFRTWLADNDAGQARTMAALDRRLRNGERSLRTLDDACAVVRRAGEVLRSVTRPRPAASAETAQPPAAGSA